MRMLTDNPTTDDKYGFNTYARYLTDSIIDTEDLPFLMGIYGAWGSGKSSLMKMIQSLLEERDIKCIWFNPWKYDNKEDLWSALIQSILYKIEEENPNEELVKNAVELAKKVAWSFVKTGVSALTQGVISGENLDNVKDTLLKENEDKFKHINSFENDFGEVILEYTGGSKLVVFVDDLDRCSPENAITVLESLKLFIGESNCVFVLGMDHRIVEQGIHHKYGEKISISGREYLDKIIQIPFYVPPVPFELLREHLEGYTKAARYSEDIWNLIQISFKSNPRKTKRFVNSFYFVIEIVTHSNFQEAFNVLSEESSDNGGGLSEELQQFILAYLLVIQMSFPDYYDFVVKTGDIYSLVDLDEMFIDGAGTEEGLIKLKEAKEELRTRYQDIDRLFENIELGLFIRDTKELIRELNVKPSKEQIILITQFVNLVSRTSSTTTTTTTLPPPPKQ